MNALQKAQLEDCLNAGMNAPRNRRPREFNKGFADTPLFSQTEQTKLF